MLDHKISPLLDAMEIGECFAQHDGERCYWLRHPESGRAFVLKHLSIPAGEGQVEALLLTGAYANEEEAEAYYRKEAEALVQEAENRKRLLDCPYVLPFLGVQMEKKEGVGYDVYAVLPKRNSLEAYLNENAVSHLQGINMGIDLCVALSALREEGFVYGNLKPGNVFFSDTGRFMLGDFGFISTDDLQYAVLPEQYRSSFSAPELSSILGGMNATVDIYSLGMILYRIYNGNHAPFEDEQTSPQAADARRVEGAPLPAPLYADYELAGIICKACAFHPSDRYQSPDEMRIELEQYMRRNAVSDHPIVPPLVTDGETLPPEVAEAEALRAADPETDVQESLSASEGRKSSREKQEKKPGKDQNKESQPEPKQRNPYEPPQVAADRRRREDKRLQTQKRKKRAWIIAAALLALLVLAVSLYEFTDLGKGKWHYFVSVDDLEVAEITADSLRLQITTDADPAEFTVYCQDSYGNSKTGRFTNGAVLFQGLSPDTAYSFRLELPGLHKLTGHTTASASTKALAEILSFSAQPDASADSVLLELQLQDESAAPAFWTLQYGKNGQEPTEIQFSGSSCQVSELEIGETYTFTLLQSENLYLSGETQVEYTPSEPVEASGLQLEAIQNGAAQLSWHCATALPESWELRCTDAEGAALAVTLQEAQPAEEGGWRCAATVSGVMKNVEYSVCLTAPGLAEPLTMTLQDVGITLSSFTAEATEDGLELHWSADRAPVGGWRITAVFDQNRQLETTARGESCVMAVLPDVDYTLTILPADGSSVMGENTVQVRSFEDRRFAQMGVEKGGTTLGLYYRPEAEAYTYSDLDLTGTVSFGPKDSVSFGVVAGGWPDDSDETVTVHYVVRDGETDEIVSVAQEERPWNTLWEDDHFVGDFRQEWFPQTPGYYSFSIYVNSKRLGTIGFTLNE
ncbi:MAG: protein kinase [Oscillospiraceae bacterium]|nr:protein kinase [Oscillospiraceae bacterium]